MLISDLQLCLAHFCDLHGPTPLMVTEGLPVPCSMCYDHEPLDYAASDARPSTAAGPGKPSSGQAAAAVTEALRRMNLGSSHRSASVPVSDQDIQEHRATFLRSGQIANVPMSAIESPPSSPRPLPDHQHAGTGGHGFHSRRDSSFRRTYDDIVTRRANPCDNCAMTLPKRQDGSAKGKGAAGSDVRNPTLRTRAPYARIYGGASGESSPPMTHTASSSDTDEEVRPAVFKHRRTGTVTSITSRSSASSVSRLASHTHYLDYTSTHEPVLPSSFSIIRASCLRTLSFETLPRHSGSSGPGSPAGTPLISPQTPSFVTTHSAGAAASGGPIFFGDRNGGYTTAYIFRIPDVHARGHKRVYAFLALSTHRESLAMKTFGFMSEAFRQLSLWIQQLAEAEAERQSESSATSSPVIANPNYGSAAFGSVPLPPQPENSAGSSFLSAGGGGLSRRMGTGFSGPGTSLRARGLPELVGLPDFFIQLHARFVRLLLELGVSLNS